MNDARDPAVPLWEQRFRGCDASFPDWARRRPERVVYASDESGSYQVYAEDLATGQRRRVTDSPIGCADGLVSPQGDGVAWFDDPRGDEVGHWVLEPFGGGAGRPLLEGVPEGWSAGLDWVDDVVAIGVAVQDGYAVWTGGPGGTGRELARSVALLEVGALSEDGELVALAHAEHGDSLHPAVRVVRSADGAVVGEAWDGPGRGLAPVAFAPLPGDSRLAINAEPGGLARPAVWDVATGARTDLALADLDGDVSVLDWWPDGTGLLCEHSHRGRDVLLRVDPVTGAHAPVACPAGSLGAAAVRPDGAVWVRHSSGEQPARVLDADSAGEVVAPRGERAPAGHPYRPWSFRNADGDEVHGFVVEPPGWSRPHPTVLLVHGGPHWLWADAYRADVATWADHGWAVALVNYRGSTGHGSAWRDRIIGDPGFPEVADELAGLDDLVATGVTDPARVVVGGGSWGGYVTLLALGLHPERFAAGLAVVPVADYVLAYADEAPALQAMDRDLFGGDPAQVPARYEERSPLTYVDRVRAPVLVIAGDNDSRCPIRQVHSYVARLAARGHDHVLDVFDAGHGSMVTDERVRQMRLELGFLGERGLLAR